MRKTICSFLLAASCCCLVIFRTEAGGSKESKTVESSTYLVRPSDGSNSVNIRQTFFAKTVDHATRYFFQISIPPDFSSQVQTYISNTNSVVVSGLQYATKYFARVKTDVNPTYDKVTSFVTNPPEAYAFVSKPSNNSSGNDAAELKVTANLVSGARRYTIELNTLPDFSGPSLIATSSIDNQRTLFFKGLQYATTYYARVKTDLSDAYGKVTHFTTREEQFAYASEPVDHTDSQDYAIMKVVLAPVYQAKKYYVELSTSTDFSDAVATNNSLNDFQRTFIFDKLKPLTTYYIRAKTDVSTGYGQTTSFTTRAALPKRRLWGVTTSGGTNGAGTVFSFSVDSLTYTRHHDNTSTEYLHGRLTPAPGGNFYGMGIQYSTGDAGEVYRIDSQGRYAVVYNGGGLHFGSLMLASNNQLYVVDDWINSFRGGIWKINPDVSDPFLSATVFHKFQSDNDGKNPIASPIELGGYLYGMAPSGGLYKDGVIYRKKFDGAFEVLHHFDGINGSSPQGSLVKGEDGYLYGMTFSGGTNNYGTIFKVKPDGSHFTKVFDFNGINGRYPFGDLVQYQDSFYGMTSEGGSADNGIIFKLSSSGTFTKLLDFTGPNGAIPMGNLTVDDSGVLFGMTANGGIHDLGIIFRMKSNGTGFTKLYDFSSGEGNPDGSLVIADDTFGGSGATLMLASAREASDAEILSYPNPFSHNMTVKLSSGREEDLTVTIKDLNGSIVHKAQGNQSLQLGDNLTQGVYIMEIAHKNTVVRQRIIKQ